MGTLDQGQDLAFDLTFHPFAGDFQVVAGLKVEPELGGSAESACQAQGSIGGNAALALHDRVDAVGRNAQSASQGILADPQRLEELFQQDLAGVDGRKVSCHITPLVVVNNFDVEGVSFLPEKAETIPIVNANAVLTFTVSTQFFQMIAGRNAQIIQGHGSVEHEQFPQGNSLEFSRQAGVTPSLKKMFGFAITEGLDHALSLS
jgi:hypothetical protein